MSATKRFQIAGRTFNIAGLSADDIYFAGLGETGDPDFTRLCTAFVGPNDVCVDIGANIGLTALTLSCFAGQVLAIEGSPIVAALLKQNVSEQANITPQHCAVADYDGEARFEDNSAFGRISQAGATVPARRLGTILATHGIDKLDFLKVDVEGSEWMILKDALELLRLRRTLIFFEFNSWGMLAGTDTNPFYFAQWITAQFSHVYMVRRGSPMRLARVASGTKGAKDILEANITRDGSVTDILATNAAEKLTGRLLDLEAELEVLRGERSEMQRQIDEALIGLEEIRGSTSWRLTAPIRWLSRRLRSS